MFKRCWESTYTGCSSDPDDILNREREINHAYAAVRGQNAVDWLHKEQQQCIERGIADIRRKKLIREKEDLRSRLIASLPSPQPVTRSRSSSRLNSNKRCSPLKKKMFSVKKKKQRWVMEEIPSNLPSSVNKKQTLIDESNDQDCNNDKRDVPMFSHHSTSNDKKIVSRNDNDDIRIRSSGPVKFNDRRMLSACNVIKANCDERKSSGDHNEVKEKQATQYSANYNCSVSALDIANHKCTGYELHSRENLNAKKSLSKSISKYNWRRRRHYSEADCYSDDSFDSDVTWPPCTPRSKSSVSGDKVASTRVEYYDHNNRFYTTSRQSRPNTCVTRLHHLQNNGASAELERINLENKVSKTQLLNSKQFKRSNKAMEKQKLRNDFHQLIEDLRKLDLKERKLRFSNLQSYNKNNPVFGETLRKEKLLNHQKRMESAVQKILPRGNLHTDNLLCNKDYESKKHFGSDYEESFLSDETPKLNVADWKCDGATSDYHVKESKPVKTSIKESDSIVKNKLNLQTLMQRINQQREMLFNEIKGNNYPTEISDSLKKEKNKNFVSSKDEHSIKQSFVSYRPSRIHESNQSSDDNKRRNISPNVDDKNIHLSEKLSPCQSKVISSFNAKHNLQSIPGFKYDTNPDLESWRHNLVKEGIISPSGKYNSKELRNSFEEINFRHSKEKCSDHSDIRHQFQENISGKAPIVDTDISPEVYVSKKPKYLDDKISPVEKYDKLQRSPSVNEYSQENTYGISEQEKLNPSHPNHENKPVRDLDICKEQRIKCVKRKDPCTCKSQLFVTKKDSKKVDKYNQPFDETDKKIKGDSNKIIEQDMVQSASPVQQEGSDENKRNFEVCKLIPHKHTDSFIKRQDEHTVKNHHFVQDDSNDKNKVIVNENDNSVSNRFVKPVLVRPVSPIKHGDQNENEICFRTHKQSDLLNKSFNDHAMRNHNSVHIDSNGEKDKVTANENESNNSNSSTETSGATLYSLDMALSKVSMDSSHDTSASSFKGVRVVVKVSGHKHDKTKDKHDKKKSKKQKDDKSKKMKLQHLEEENLLLVDKSNQRNMKDASSQKQQRQPLVYDESNGKGIKGKEKEQHVPPDQSAGSSSTSYLSPPDHLSPEQLDMLNSIFKKIENKDYSNGIPMLKQYILKLLSMSRESIDRLGVSSSDVSIQSSLFQDDQYHNSFKKTEESIVDENHEEESAENKNYVKSDQFDFRRDFDILKQQVNEYFKNKLDDKKSKARNIIETNEIVSKYTELAKSYAERISNLAEMIGDINTCEAIKKSLTINDETSYLSLPSETHVNLPLGNVEPCERISPTFINGDMSHEHHKSWHHELSFKSNDVPQSSVPISQISSHILPLPPQINTTHQHNISSASSHSKPPPTMLNGKIRMCTPHELSTIQEIDTPSTSRQLPNKKAKPDQRTSLSPSSHHNQHELDGIPLSNEKIEDINLSFLTLQSQEDKNSDEDVASNESIPNIMEELLRRGILTSPFSWAKDYHDDNVKSDKEYDIKNKDVYNFMEDLSSSQLADEEVRVILKESSPEDIETAFESLGLGWASTTLRKTRQAGELSADSSSSNGIANRSRLPPSRSNKNLFGLGTSTPDNSLILCNPSAAHATLIPKSEEELSTINKVSSNNNIAYTLSPPDVSLLPNSKFRTLSDESIDSFS
ncbi:uncharacterized protein LOC142327630 isoform X2 [Lycorma delicatula]|uniref:uncharacterized protein LOC142327630 isoform X2 n=1 Tax=Lycorma delicatula TaxID=130591 RepID=UPI003F510323